MSILLADVGGTNARLALARDGVLDPASITRYRGDDFASFDDVVRTYLAALNESGVEAVCVDVAGPVSCGKAELTNRDWSFSTDRLKTLTGADQALIINDLTALGYAVPGLGDGARLLRAASGAKVSNGQRLVVNAGTGFNVCAVKTLEDGFIVCLEAEEGHTRLPLPIAALIVDEVGQRAATAYHSTEEIFSGRGLARLHADRTGRAGARAEDVVRLASDGDADAIATCTFFAGIFGLLCRELALRFMPFDGLYLAGSVARSCAAQMDVFGASFQSDQLMRHVPDATPLLVIEDDLAALYGCLAAVCRKIP